MRPEKRPTQRPRTDRSRSMARGPSRATAARCSESPAGPGWGWTEWVASFRVLIPGLRPTPDSMRHGIYDDIDAHRISLFLRELPKIKFVVAFLFPAVPQVRVMADHHHDALLIV